MAWDQLEDNNTWLGRIALGNQRDLGIQWEEEGEE